MTDKRKDRITEIINYKDEYNKNLLFYFCNIIRDEDYKIDDIHLELYSLIYEECIDENKTEDINLHILQKLINYGIDINNTDYNNIPVLFYYFIRNINIAKILIENGADINISIKDNRKSELTLLEIACKDDNTDLIEYLVSKGLNINFSNMYNQNALHYLCINNSVIFRGDIPIYNILYLLGIDVNQQDIYGNSPLHYACMYNTSHVVSSLLYNNANINILNDYGQNALMVRLENKEYYKCDNIYCCIKLIEENIELGIMDVFEVSDYEYALKDKENNKEIIEIFKSRPEVIEKIKNFKIKIFKEEFKNLEIKLFDNIIDFIL